MYAIQNDTSATCFLSLKRWLQTIAFIATFKFKTVKGRRTKRRSGNERGERVSPLKTEEV